MKRTIVLGVVFSTVLTIALPFVGGGGPSFLTSVPAEAAARTISAASTAGLAPDRAAVAAAVGVQTVSVVAAASSAPNLTVDSEHLAQKPVPIPVVVAPGPGGAANAGATMNNTSTPQYRIYSSDSAASIMA